MTRRIVLAGAICFLLAARALVPAADKTSGPAYPNHANVMIYRDEADREHPVTSPADWLKRRAHIVAGMEQAMGPLPDLSKLPPLDVRVDDTKTVKGEGYTRLTLSYVA